MIRAILLAAIVLSVGLSTAADQTEDSMSFIFRTYSINSRYVDINDYLTKATDSTKFDENMRLAEEWLEREKARGVDQTLIEALEQFTEMKSLLHKCNSEGHYILWRNDQATGDLAREDTSEMDETPERIVGLVRDAALDHAIICLHVFPSRFREIREQIDSPLMDRVDAIMDEHLASNNSLARLFDRGTNEIDPKRVVSGIKSISYNEAARLAYDVIKAYSRTDKNRAYLAKVMDKGQGKSVVHRDKIKQLVVKYLVEPCSFYVKTFGPDVYIPAIYEAEVLQDKYNPLAGPNFNGFVYGWVTYRVCETMVADKSKLIGGVMSIIDGLTPAQ